MTASTESGHLLGCLRIPGALPVVVKLPGPQHACCAKRELVDPVCVPCEHADRSTCVGIPDPYLPIIGAGYKHVVSGPHHRVHCAVSYTHLTLPTNREV